MFTITSRSSALKILRFSAFVFSFIFFFCTGIHSAHAGSCQATATGSWTTTTWSAGCGGVGGIPTTGDDVTINSGVTVTLDTATPVLNTLTITGTLDTSGTNYDVSTAALTISSTGTLTANASTITLSGTSGTLFTKTSGGVFTQGTSTVIVTSASGTPTLLSAATTFYRLTINSAATVINDGAIVTIQNVSGSKLYVQAGVLNLSSQAVGPGSGNGTLQVDSSATLCLGGTSGATNATCDSGTTAASAITLPSFQTYTLDPTSTVIYLSNAGVTLSSAAVTFGNVTVRSVLTNAFVWNTASTVTTTIAGNLDLNPSGGATGSFHQMSLNIAGPLVISGSLTLEGHTSSVAGFSQFASLGSQTMTVQRIIIASGVSNFLLGSGMTINLTGTSGTLFSNSANWSQTGSTVNVISASGTPTLVTASTSFEKLTINSAATVVNATGAVTISNVSGSQLYVQSGVFNPSAGVTGPGGSNGTLQIDSGGTLCLGGTTSATNATCDSGATQTTARTMPTFQTYTFNAASTVNYLSDAATTVSNTPTYGNLKLNPVLTAARTYTLGGAMTINGNWDINPNSSGSNLLTVNAAGTMTVAAGKTLTLARQGSTATSLLDIRPSSTDYNISTGGLMISTGGTLDGTGAASTIGVAGNLSNGGTFTPGSTAVTLNGTSQQTVSGTFTGGASFYDLAITNVTGVDASDGERTAFVPSVIFSNALTSTHNYTITTGSVRVQYNSGSTYTFTNINWNGGATGTKIFFRNSTTSGTWILNVSGTQTAVAYINVSRSDAGGGSAITASNTIDSGSNSHWTFLNSSPDVPASLGPTNKVNGSSSGSSTPLVSFTITDSDGGDTVQYQIKISTHSDFSSPVVDYTSALAAQGSTSFTVGQAAGSGSYSTGSSGQHLSDGSYYWEVRALDNSAAASSYALANSGAVAFVIDSVIPVISEVTPVLAIGTDTTPNYTFTTSKDGTISYGGSCTSATTSATSGSNTITFSTLPYGTYSNCTVTVTDASSNASNLLSVTSFRVVKVNITSVTTNTTVTTTDTSSGTTTGGSTDSSSGSSTSTSIPPSTSVGAGTNQGQLPSTNTSSTLPAHPIFSTLPNGKVLKTGDARSEVMELQKYLNTHGFILATRGPGSPGNETNYFGTLTRSMLIKFQETYASSILAPLKLKKGTGILGSFTIQYIKLHP